MNVRSIAVPAEARQLAVLTQFLQEFCSAQSVPDSVTARFELALEELFVNVVTHGAPERALPRVEVALAFEGGALTMAMEDDGPEFNPLSLPEPDISAPLAARPIGGLGIHLVRQLMDAVSYEHAAGRNRVVMTRHA